MPESAVTPAIDENPGPNIETIDETLGVEKAETAQFMQILSNIEEQLKYLKNQQKDKDTVGDIRDQWEKVTEFIEQVLFWVFIVVIVIMSIVLLVVVPMTAPNATLEEYIEKSLASLVVRSL